MEALREPTTIDTTWDFYRTGKEVRKSRRRTEEWIIPVIRKFCGTNTNIRVLSVGCGSAVDVAVLRQHGYDCWGTDLTAECHPDAQGAFLQANACSLPFQSCDFDVTMCLEAFEHIGAPNTNREWKPCPEYMANRKKAASELLRVTKPRGVVILVTPNRLFPVDEHGPGASGFRWHMPIGDMTLSYFELKRLFLPACEEVGTLPYGRYFELEKLERLGGPLLARLVSCVLPIFSSRLLHCSPLGPHLFVYFRKAVAQGVDIPEARKREVGRCVSA
jgi:SAM-dependent methyltransferase